MNAIKNNMKDTFLLGWVILLLLGGVFLLINFIFAMPYDKWFSENIPAWFSVLNCILLGACLVIMAIPVRSMILNNIAWTVGLLSAIISKTTFTKALGINIIVVLISVIFYATMKHHYRGKEGRN